LSRGPGDEAPSWHGRPFVNHPGCRPLTETGPVYRQSVVAEWERHDFASYAHDLPGVKRLRRAAYVCWGVGVGCIPLPLIAGLLDLTWLLRFSPLFASAFVAVGSVVFWRSLHRQQRAIAAWVTAAERAARA
jgi:hypothetical protein